MILVLPDQVQVLGGHVRWLLSGRTVVTRYRHAAWAAARIIV